VISTPSVGGNTVTFTRLRDVRAALGNAHLVHRLGLDAVESGSIVEGSMIDLEGVAHRDRRRVLNRFFRIDRLALYEHELMPEIVERTLDQIGPGEADLVELAGVVAMELAALTAGIDVDPDSLEQKRDLVRLERAFNKDVGGEDSREDVRSTRAAVRAALEEFRARYFESSRRRREAALNNAADVDDVLTTLLQHRGQFQLADDQLVRETALFIVAGAHTTSQTLTYVIHHVLEWIEAHPGAREELVGDAGLLQAFVHEAIRLRPINVLMKRRAVADTEVNGTPIAAGTIVVLDTVAANRDAAEFGPDAANFNPFRALPASVPTYGASFGGGIHACIGRVQAVGVLAHDDEPADHELRGLLTVVARALLRRNVRSDPARSPSMDPTTIRARWLAYPVLID
jgi:cytochrome P450